MSIIKEKTQIGLQMSLTQQVLMLCFLLFYAIRFLSPMSVMDWVVNLGCLGVFLIVYFAAFRYPRFALACTFVMIALTFVVAPYNYGASTFAIYAASFVGWIVSRRQAFLLIGLNGAVLVFATYLYSLPWLGFALWSIILVVLVGLSSLLNAEHIQHLEEQQKNREELKRLAVIAERERIGRDLHDLLGHTLSLIHLKTQLSIKHADNGDIEALQQELEQIRTVSSDSLKEVRSAVSGYRNQRLATELTAHKQYFDSAGIRLHWDMPELTLAPAIEGELALVVREALTNVIRHSGATNCEIIITQPARNQLQLCVQDNGKGGTLNAGNGINGLKQRLQELGGNLSICGKSGCLLTATLPWQ